MITDFFAAESAIVQQLSAALPGVAVLTSGELAAQDGRIAKTPYVLVLYGGERVDGQVARGDASFAVQRWFVVLTVKDGGTRQSAGTLILDILRALAGWQPLAEARPMRRAEAPEPEYTDGLASFPLAFELPIPIKI